MSELLFKVLTFLTQYRALFAALVNAIESGADKESLLQLLEAAMVKGSDVAMKAELTK